VSTGGLAQDAAFREFWGVWKTEGLEGILCRYEEFFTEDAVWEPPLAEITRREYIGREGFRRYVNDFSDAFEGVGGGDIEEMEAVAPDVWRARVQLAIHQAGSEVAVEAHVYSVVRYRGERMCWAFGTYDPHAARRAIEAARRGEVPV
jgi:hypothetical protein